MMHPICRVSSELMRLNQNMEVTLSEDRLMTNRPSPETGALPDSEDGRGFLQRYDSPEKPYGEDVYPSKRKLSIRRVLPIYTAMAHSTGPSALCTVCMETASTIST